MNLWNDYGPIVRDVAPVVSLGDSLSPRFRSGLRDSLPSEARKKPNLIHYSCSCAGQSGQNYTNSAFIILPYYPPTTVRFLIPLTSCSVKKMRKFIVYLFACLFIYLFLRCCLATHTPILWARSHTYGWRWRECRVNWHEAVLMRCTRPRADPGTGNAVTPFTHVTLVILTNLTCHSDDTPFRSGPWVL